MRATDDASITVGSGNVFADLGLTDAGERLVKARLAGWIQDALEARGWTAEQAAGALSLDQADASRLLAGRLKGFSVARLTGLLAVAEDVA